MEKWKSQRIIHVFCGILNLLNEDKIQHKELFMKASKHLKDTVVRESR